MGTSNRKDRASARMANARRTGTRNACEAIESLGTGDELRAVSKRQMVGQTLLSAEDVVADVLNLPDIRDPARWLRRHRAPAALRIGTCKRYLLADVLRWASRKFSLTEGSEAALAAIASGLETGSLGADAQ